MLGLGLGRFLPREGREYVQALEAWSRQRIAALAAPTSGEDSARSLQLRRWFGRPRVFRGERVALIGFFRSHIGLARGAELLRRELTGQNAVVYKVDATRALGHPESVDCKDCLDVAQVGDLDVTDIVLNLNPPEFYELSVLLRSFPIGNKALVCYVAWELNRVPPSWRICLACVDEVWVPSDFVRDALLSSFPDLGYKVAVRPHRTDLDPWLTPTSAQRSAARNSLAAEEATFVVLTSFSMRSSMARKNPIGAVRAFKRAFPDPSTPTKLIIRCLDAAVFSPGVGDLVQVIADDPRIVLMSGAALRPIRDCYHAADAYISLHRGEGFGLNIAEALMLDIPVVATTYSLNEYFLSHPFFIGIDSIQVPVIDGQHRYDSVPNTTWAEPNLHQAADELLRLFQKR